MAIICTNSHEKLTKIKIRSSWVGSNIAQNHSFGHQEIIIWSLFAPIHMKSSPKSKLGKVGVGSNFAQNYSI